MAGALEIVKEDRKALVDKIISMMESGYFLQRPEWNREALRPRAGTWLCRSLLGDRPPVHDEGLPHQKGRARDPLREMDLRQGGEGEG